MGDPKDWLELSMVNKKYHENLKIPISRKIMQLHIDDDIRRKVWPNFILPEFRKLKVDSTATMKN